ncbi:hypothetical protein Tco_0753083 [Tanacetum coccineum]
MVACLEKIEGNSDFHKIMDFLASSLIHHALTISSPIYTSYIEQFWNIVSSQIVNDVKQIDATVDSKAVVVTKASIRSGHTSDRAEGALNLQELSVLCTNLSNRVLALESIKDAQAAEISALKSRIKKLEKKCKPSILHHKAWLKSAQVIHEEEIWNEGVCIQTGEEKSKPESTLDDNTVFDDQDADHGMEYIKTKEVVDEGRQSGETEEVKLTDDT